MKRALRMLDWREARRSSLEDILLCGKLRRVSRRCWRFKVGETGESLALVGENKRRGFVLPFVLSPYLVKLGFNPQSTIPVCTLLLGTHLDRVDLKRRD